MDKAMRKGDNKVNTTQNPSPRFLTNFIVITLFTFLLSSCPQPNGSAPKNNPVNPSKSDKTLVVFDNTHGLCTALVYDDYRRRSEDKIAEVPAGQRSAEIEYYPGDSAPFYFAYVISLNDFNDFTMNYVPKNGMDQRTVNIAANKTTTVLIPKLDETFSKKDQLLSARSFLLLQNASNYSFELHQGRSSVKPDGAVSSPVVNSSEKAFYTIKPNSSGIYKLLVGTDYKDFPSTPEKFRAGYFYNFTYNNGNVVWDREIPLIIDNIAVKTYTVTFNANGGEGNPPDSQIANASSEVTLPNGGGLSKQGYTFGGWNASAIGTEINYGAGATYTVTGDIDLYATWYPIGTIIYTVGFDSDGGSAVASQDIVSGKQAFQPADPIRRGNIFIDWYADPGFNNVYDFSKPVTGAITLYAKWEAIKYTVTFNANGANGTTPASQTVNALSSITLPNGNGLSNAGYNFGGWSVDDTGTNVYDIGESFIVESDITLFAVWNLQPYTVNFYSNGGSAVQSQSVTYGSITTRPADPVRNGYKFVGWYINTGLTDVYNFSNTVTGNVTLYAKWSSLVNGIRLNKNAISLEVNETETLIASINTGNTLIDTITWSSNNTSVATVAPNGKVTAARVGTAVISVLAEGGLQAAQCVVKVTGIIDVITGITVPATGSTPVTIITETAHYTGIVEWNPNDNQFKFGTVYTATITLTLKTGYNLQSVPENYFMVAGAMEVNNAANSGVITAVFPATVSIVETVYVAGGSFDMGMALGIYSGINDVKPIHKVTLTGFYMGKYEITQEQYKWVIGSNPSSFSSNPAAGEVQEKRPVETVNWYDAIVFCNRLSIEEGLSPAYSISGSTNPDDWGSVPGSNDGAWTWNAAEIVSGATGYRLPTEAQWEYAAKGGASPGNYAFSGSNTAGDVAWYSDNSGNKTHEVGKKAPNGLGIYDMTGNVFEWCWDWDGSWSYPSSAQTDPVGESSGTRRIQRGGNFVYSSSSSSSTVHRGFWEPFLRGDKVGFRITRP